MLTSDLRPATAFLDGGAHDDRPALIAHGHTVDRGELRRLVDQRGDELPLPQRSLVILTGETSLDFVVCYLALLQQGHVPLLAGAHVDRLVDAWPPAAVIRADRTGWSVDRRAATSGRCTAALHDDLALLLSTSGSTGSPKLVRLSHHNLVSNAASIVEYLGLMPDDVGITSLPLHYCYGLSVLHSHLLAGASVVLTHASVVDPCFAAAVREHGVTGLAGVPHTFELLEHAGCERIAVPSLRMLTQAGGRMEPTRVLEWADRAERWGARFFVMYGQTEATARMAYVPPDRLRAAPHAIGLPIPGGQLSIRPIQAAGGEAIRGDVRQIAAGDVAGGAVGELVYRGPNVMLGYAEHPSDLARGRDTDELATGDLARRDPATGMFVVVGRRSRTVKPFGVRIDLDEVQRRLVDTHPAAGDLAVVGDDQGLVVVAPTRHHGAVAAACRELLGLPQHAWTVVDVPVPRTDRGKVATGELLVRARCAAEAGRGADGVTDGADGRDDMMGALSATDAGVANVYRTVLGRADVRPHDTFVSLGGDSLSYVECSVRLEALLGSLPEDWHVRRVDEFPAPRPSRRVRRIDTSVLLRTIGILAVVATHMGVLFFPGGAHLMLVVVGYNVSRFLLDVEPARERLRAGARAVARVAVPTVVWAAVGLIAFGAYSAGTVALVNNYVGPRSHADDHWHFWFVEVLVHLTVLVVALSLVPAVRSFDRRHRYRAPLTLLAVTLVLRMEWAWMGDWYNLRFRTHGVAFFFVLGLLVHRSTAWRTRLATTAIAAAVVPGFFDRPQREWFIVGGLVLLMWSRQVPLPALLVRPVAAIAAASMWIYLSHFTFWPLLEQVLDREVAYVLTITAGVAVWLVARAVEPQVVAAGRWARDVRRQRRRPTTALST